MVLLKHLEEDLNKLYSNSQCGELKETFETYYN